MIADEQVTSRFAVGYRTCLTTYLGRQAMTTILAAVGTNEHECSAPQFPACSGVRACHKPSRINFPQIVRVWRVRGSVLLSTQSTGMVWTRKRRAEPSKQICGVVATLLNIYAVSAVAGTVSHLARLCIKKATGLQVTDYSSARCRMLCMGHIFCAVDLGWLTKMSNPDVVSGRCPQQAEEVSVGQLKAFQDANEFLREAPITQLP